MRSGTSKVILINGEEIPAPDEGYIIQEMTNVDAGRNVNGVVVGQKVGRNIWKIDSLKWSSLSAAAWKRIKRLLKPFFVKVTFTADDNERHTVTMYPGDREGTPVRINHLEYERFKECKFNLIDCGKFHLEGNKIVED